jgi:uncharacterized protein YdaU (DUF1376 family)
MKHYPHHIGDFDRATRHLTRIERSVYRDLLDLYYDTEGRLPLDIAWLCRKIVARSNEESTVVEQTLNEFFTKTPTGWYHSRCEEEIAAYRANNSQRAQAGKASAAAKALKKQQALNENSTTVEHPLNPVATNGNGASTNQSTNQPINQSTSGNTACATRKPRATRNCPESFEVTDDLKTWAIQNFPAVDLLKQTGAFRDHTFKTAITDWAGAWRNWIRRSNDYAAPQARGSPQAETPYAAHMRQRVEQAAGSMAHIVAAKAPGSTQSRQIEPWDEVKDDRRTIEQPSAGTIAIGLD